MSKLDKIKEEIGWLKLVFGILVAIDVSLIGWIVQSFSTTPIFLLIIAAFMVCLITWAMVVVNRNAYKRMDELGDL